MATRDRYIPDDRCTVSSDMCMGSGDCRLKIACMGRDGVELVLS